MNNISSISYNYKKRLGIVNSKQLRIELMYNQSGVCYLCSTPEWKIKKSFHTHRIIPGKDNGLYNLDNTILVCQKCHTLIEGLSLKDIDVLRKTQINLPEKEVINMNVPKDKKKLINFIKCIIGMILLILVSIAAGILHDIISVFFEGAVFVTATYLFLQSLKDI